MNYRDLYTSWLNNKFFDEKTREELAALKDNEAEIEDRFYKELEFGTAGLRGKLGAGTNRMNIYNISRATQGLADFIKEQGQSYMDRGVAIAYDCRHFSDVFAKRAALVLAANGIKVYLYESLRPTPLLSYTVRHFNTASGIVVTASHNPKEYNGYKVYWEDGAQIGQEMADAITGKILAIKSFEDVSVMDEQEAIDKGLLNIIGKEIDDIYVEKVKALALREDIDKDIKVVYTPLNGTGNVLVRRVLKERGFNNITVVPEQENPDPNFTTAPFPNPEDSRAFEYAENLGREIGADLLLATDPDCDRLAIMVKDKDGSYVAFNGNQTGAMLVKYIVEARLETGKLPENAFIVKSIVTGDLGRAIAAKYGVETYEALTGFKNICGVANALEKAGDKKFIFGYEESIGYVTGDFVKDKDGVISSMMLCEAAAYYKKQGKNLIEVLEETYKEFGYYREKQISLVLEGVEGSKRIGRMMEAYRAEYPTEVEGIKLTKYTDLKKGIVTDVASGETTPSVIPSSNVLLFTHEDGSWYAVRPSGTEPKIKLYIYSKGETSEAAEMKIASFEKVALGKLNSIE
ncbi:MAG: phospho-sugar mutase [Clostridiaceae bacterium]